MKAPRDAAHAPVLALVVDNVVDLRFLPDVPEPEPGLEDGEIIKNLGVHEVQETPELF